MAALVAWNSLRMDSVWLTLQNSLGFAYFCIRFQLYWVQLRSIFFYFIIINVTKRILVFQPLYINPAG